MPAEGLTLADKQRINKQLLESGAHIGEMNCVRKHLSRIKGGRLAAACAPAKVVTLTISDVPGDDPAVIASGPTVPDATTCADALAILDRYRIEVPPAVRARLESGELETPQPGDGVFRGHATHLIATPQQSLEAAAAAARAAGIEAHILSDEMEGESREVGKVHGALARAVAHRGAPFARPCVILSGGETTVTIRPRAPGAPKGRGGRAGEFCLGLAGALRGKRTFGRWPPTPTASTVSRTTPAPSSRPTRWRARRRRPHAGRPPGPQRRLRLLRRDRRPAGHRPRTPTSTTSGR